MSRSLRDPSPIAGSAPLQPVGPTDHCPDATDDQSMQAALAHIVREYAARLATALVRVTGDFGAAEDLVQDAIVAALWRWPTDGIPARPDAWLFTVARNRARDLHRR
jgi:RNA polymerase sigma-70 factor (ECF subfamily)